MILKLFEKTYTDIALVEGVYNHDPRMENALYKRCKNYFDENYKIVFFTGEDEREDIFQEAFVLLWNNIEKQHIYVENGMLKGKDGLPFVGKLTTYFMSIARIKNLEIARQNKRKLSVENEERNKWEEQKKQYMDLVCGSKEDVGIEVIADCVSHMSKRCCQILTMFYYEEKTLDDIMAELPTFESKNALKTAKYKCMETLRKSATLIRQRLINS